VTSPTKINQNQSKNDELGGREQGEEEKGENIRSSLFEMMPRQRKKRKLALKIVFA